MDHLVPAAPWLLALAGVVSGVACLAAGRGVPWQARQMALLRSAALLALAFGGGETLPRLVIGVALLLSAMIGTIGVRGSKSAPMCFHRALVSLVLAICLWDTVAGPAATSTSAAAGPHDHGPAFTGVLSVLGIVGVVGVVLWTIVSEHVLEPVRGRRAQTMLAVESWSMAAGVAVLCLAV
ncbi:hypothetical protein [Microbacterium sp. 1.5R]|uniref:hypothetical protein n=1 Tax=Microbacterium sp. 1.5R TaxID=1916917 RepID=UPI0011AA4434|nr:hypothetical protein [Microbacterium sp. 1.5R]